MGKTFIRREEVIASFKAEWRECNDLVTDEEITEHDLKQRWDALCSTAILLGIEWEEIAE